jgi:hypothetical protein
MNKNQCKMRDKNPIVIPIKTDADSPVCAGCDHHMPKDALMLVYDYDFFCDERCGTKRFCREVSETEGEKRAYMLGYLEGIEHRKKFKEKK